MQTFEYQLLGNTKQAVQANDNLENSVKGITKSTEQLNAEFDKSIQQSEIKIKAIGGSVNLLGGAVETVVGTLGLIGVPPEIQEQFQKAAGSAIAFADGVKRIFEGFKELTEARKLFQGVQVASSVAQSAETAAVTANTTAQVANNAATTAASAAKATQINRLQGTSAAAKATNTVIDTLNKTTAAGAAAGAAARVAFDGFTKSIGTFFNAISFGTGPLGGFLIALGAAATAYALLTKNSKEARQALIAQAKIENELSAVSKKASANEERLLRVLTDKVSQRGLETQAIEELKKAYPGFEAFLTRENQLTEKGIAFLKTRIELRRAEAGLAAVTEKLVQEEVNLAEKITELREEYGFTTQANKLINEERQESARRTATLTEKEKQYTDQVNNALLALVPFNKQLTSYAKSVAPASIDATDKAVISLDFYRTALEKLNAEQKKRNEALAKEVRLSLDVEGSLEESGKNFIKRQSTIPSVVETTATETTKAYATQALAFNAFINGLQSDLIDFLSSGAGEAIQTGLSSLQSLLSEFGDLQQEAIDIQLGALERRYQRDLQLAGENAALKEQITREFEANELEIARTSLDQQKKLRRGQVIVTTAQSIINAYSSTSTLPPPFGIIAGTILAGAYTALGAKALANINATSLDSSDAAGGFNNIPSGGGFSIPGGAGVPAGSTGGPLPGLGGGRIGAPTIGTIEQEPLRAYVLAGDVTNGVQANIALNNRRRLAG
jgi:hypothetical protein